VVASLGGASLMVFGELYRSKRETIELRRGGEKLAADCRSLRKGAEAAS
jgi:hypothetical protein